MYCGFFVRLYWLNIICTPYVLMGTISFLQRPSLLQSVQQFLCKVVLVKIIHTKPYITLGYGQKVPPHADNKLKWDVISSLQDPMTTFHWELQTMCPSLQLQTIVQYSQKKKGQCAPNKDSHLWQMRWCWFFEGFWWVVWKNGDASNCWIWNNIIKNQST